jgi:hypothetical protein
LFANERIKKCIVKCKKWGKYFVFKNGK